MDGHYPARISMLTVPVERRRHTVRSAFALEGVTRLIEGQLALKKSIR